MAPSKRNLSKQNLAVGAVLLVAVISAVAFVCVSRMQAREAPPVVAKVSAIHTFEDLLHANPEELRMVDIATMNLLCASDLPGAENMDIHKCLSTLNRFAATVESQTQKYLPMYISNPEKFRNMEGFFRMQMLITVLKEDLGVDYSPERTNDEPMESFFANSKDLFLNGLLAPPHTGTCASLPVLVTAVARKLGYPVYLVETRGHLFARWESADGSERFNIESTNGGMGSKPDEHYKQGIYQWDDTRFGKEGYLQNLNPRRELADFLDLRGLCLRANGRFAEARQVYETCVQLKPASKIYAAKLERASEEERTGQLIAKN